MKMENSKLKEWHAAGGRLSTPIRKRHKLTSLFPYMKASGKEGIQIGALLNLFILLALPFITLKVVEQSLQPNPKYLFPTKVIATLEFLSPIAPPPIYGTQIASPVSVLTDAVPVTVAPDPWAQGSVCVSCGIVGNEVLLTPRPVYGSGMAGFAADPRRTVPTPLPTLRSLPPRAPVVAPYTLPGGPSVRIIPSGSLLPSYGALPTAVLPTAYFIEVTHVYVVVVTSTASPMVTPSPAPSSTDTMPDPSLSATPRDTLTSPATNDPTSTPTATVTLTPLALPSVTWTPVPTGTSTPTATNTPTETPTLSGPEASVAAPDGVDIQ